MWKTRFEINTSHRNNSKHISSSKKLHHYYSQSSLKSPRIRSDSPNKLIRQSSLSVSNLEIVNEENEDNIPYSNIINNEQQNLVSITLRRRNSYQIILPTIIETNDHDIMNENILNNNNNNESLNYNNDKTTEKINFTFNKHLNDVLQQNKSICLSKDINNNENIIPTTFKDISAFFENKILKEKKFIRAKRTLSLNQYNYNNNLTKLKNISSIEDKSNDIYHQDNKRIKIIDKSDFNSIIQEEKKFFFKQWLKFLVIFFIIFIYLIKYYQFNYFYQYGQFIQNYFFSIFHLFITFIGQIFFHIDKYEYKNNIIYVTTSTYDTYIYDFN